MQQQDVQRWDEIHKSTFSEQRQHSGYAQDKERLFPRESLVCDLGGGTGEDILYFLKQGHRVVLFDISSFAINKTQERVNKAELSDRFNFRQVDFGLHKLPLIDNSVDIVYSRISLNYFGNRQTTKIFADTYRVLKPGGAAYLAFKSARDEKEMDSLNKIGTVYEPGVYIENDRLRSRFSEEQLSEMLTDAGIVNFTVSPYEERIEDDQGEGVISLNDISFTKS